MKVMLCAGIVSVVVGLSAAEPESAGIDGVWKAVKGEIAGQAMPAGAVKAITLTVKGAEYDVFVATENEHDQGTAKISASASPKTIDITSTNGPNKGKTMLAIYERHGDTLKVCYDLTGTKRPHEFKAPAGTKHFLVSYERKKDSK